MVVATELFGVLLWGRDFKGPAAPPSCHFSSTILVLHCFSIISTIESLRVRRSPPYGVPTYLPNSKLANAKCRYIL